MRKRIYCKLIIFILITGIFLFYIYDVAKVHSIKENSLKPEIVFSDLFNLQKTTFRQEMPADTRIIKDTNLQSVFCDKNETKDIYVNSSIYDWTPRDLFRMPVPKFIPGIKTPCFYVEDDGSHLFSNGSVRISDKLVMKCFPHTFLIGVEKSGTSDLYFDVAVHHHILVPMHGNRERKEPLFFNGIWGEDIHNRTMGGYLHLMDHAARIIHENCMQGTKVVPPIGYTECPYVLVDFSARTMNHNYNWDEDKENEGLPVPSILVPHKIHRIFPDAKILVLLRNPVTRLYSDYRFYRGPHPVVISPQDFHSRVVSAIDIWNICIHKLLLPLDRCAYGYHWPEGFETGRFWQMNSPDRLRTSIYFATLKDWYEVFPRDNIKVLRLEDYSQHKTEAVKNLLPFLGLDNFTPYEDQQLLEIEQGRNINQQPPGEPMMDETKSILEKFYEPYNKQLAELVNDNAFLWQN